MPAGTGSHPLRLDLLVELDSMENRAITEASLTRVVGAFAGFAPRFRKRTADANTTESPMDGDNLRQATCEPVEEAPVGGE